MAAIPVQVRHLTVLMAVVAIGCSPEAGGSTPPDPTDDGGSPREDARVVEDGGERGDGGEPGDAAVGGGDAGTGGGDDAGRDGGHTDAAIEADGGDPGGDDCGGCPAGEMCCDGQCVDTQFHPQHCGGCSQPCDARDQICYEGSCVAGDECGPAGDCGTGGSCCGRICCLPDMRCVTEGNFIGCCPDGDDCG